MSKLTSQWIVENTCADCGTKVKARGDQISTTLEEFGRYLCDDCAAEKMEGARIPSRPVDTVRADQQFGPYDRTRIDQVGLPRPLIRVRANHLQRWCALTIGIILAIAAGWLAGILKGLLT